MPLTRKCGPCQACCTVLAVDEIGKPEQLPCDKLCADGCGVYATRPAACRAFQCIWLQGEIHRDFRPDKSGVMLYLGSTIFSPTTVHAAEVWAGAGDGADVRALLEKFREYAPVIILRKDGTRSLLANEAWQVDKVQQFIAEGKK